MEAIPYGSRWEAVFNAWLKGGEEQGASRPFLLVSGLPPSQISGAHAPIDPRVAAAAAQRAAQAVAPKVVKPGDEGVSAKVFTVCGWEVRVSMGRAVLGLEGGGQDGKRWQQVAAGKSH